MSSPAPDFRSQPPLVFETCIECGLDFAISRGLYEVRRNDGEPFSCPNGHRQSFVTEAEKEAERAKQTFSASDYADNGILQAQVKYLSEKLKEAQLALKVATAGQRRSRPPSRRDTSTSREV